MQHLWLAVRKSKFVAHNRKCIAHSPGDQKEFGVERKELDRLFAVSATFHNILPQALRETFFRFSRIEPRRTYAEAVQRVLKILLSFV